MIKEILSLATIAGALKKVKRKGWITWVGIENPESVAEHSFRCAVLAMCIGDLKKLNTEKLIKITLLHDIHEALTGDYDYFDKQRMGKEVHKREKEAMKKLSSKLPKKIRKEYLSLWNEFKNQETEEAKLAREIDKLEMVMQALEYDKEGYDHKKLQVFWKNASAELRDPILKALFKLLTEEKDALESTM